MIRFDEWWEQDEGQVAEEGGASCPWPADGRHSGKIVRVRDEKFSFMERHGADGRCLAIDVQIPKCRRVEKLVSVRWRAAIAEVCRAARVHQPDPGVEWDPQQLVGRHVSVETVTAMRKDGTDYSRIEKWFPMPEPLPVETAAAAPSPAATRRRKPEAVAGPDDIPF